jgi:GNAT superfamily N-acetyltransferase
MGCVTEPRPVAEQSVRVAWAADAAEIARVQVRAWREAYSTILPADLLQALDEEAFAEQWKQSLAKPPDARNRGLVALEATTVVGFAATGPAEDPDADRVTDGVISAFHIDPGATGQGHGSRLLHACVDTLRADGFGRATTWLFSQDDAMRGFLTATGWAPDGAHRELDLHGDGSVLVKQVRLHCSLAED